MPSKRKPAVRHTPGRGAKSKSVEPEVKTPLKRRNAVRYTPNRVAKSKSVEPEATKSAKKSNSPNKTATPKRKVGRPVHPASADQPLRPDHQFHSTRHPVILTRPGGNAANVHFRTPNDGLFGGDVFGADPGLYGADFGPFGGRGFPTLDQEDLATGNFGSFGPTGELFGADFGTDFGTYVMGRNPRANQEVLEGGDLGSFGGRSGHPGRDAPFGAGVSEPFDPDLIPLPPSQPIKKTRGRPPTPKKTSKNTPKKVTKASAPIRKSPRTAEKTATPGKGKEGQTNPAAAHVVNEQSEKKRGRGRPKAPETKLSTKATPKKIAKTPAKSTGRSKKKAHFEEDSVKVVLDTPDLSESGEDLDWNQILGEENIAKFLAGEKVCTGRKDTPGKTTKQKQPSSTGHCGNSFHGKSVDEAKDYYSYSEEEECHCATQNPIYPYGENGEGGPGIAYTCTCPDDAPTSPKKKGKAASSSKAALELGQAIYRSGAGSFTGNLKPGNTETRYELSSYCEHKVGSDPVWDPTNNLSPCKTCPSKVPRTPGNCLCPREDAIIFTVRAKTQVNGRDDWSPVVDGDVLDLRGHCCVCNKLTRKDDRYRGIGEEFKWGNATFERFLSKSKKEKAAAEHHKQWNRAFKEDTEEWHCLGGGIGSSPEEHEDRKLNEQWNRAGTKDPRREEQSPEGSLRLWNLVRGMGSKSEICPDCTCKIEECECDVGDLVERGCQCEGIGGCGRNEKCVCKGKRGGCECTKGAEVCDCQEPDSDCACEEDGDCPKHDVKVKAKMRKPIAAKRGRGRK